jgi:hypothetical protein
MLFIFSKTINLKNPFRNIDIAENSDAKLKYLKAFHDFVIIYGTDKVEKNAEPLTNMMQFVQESSELIDSYLNKSTERRVGKDFHYYFVSKIDQGTYVGYFAVNYRGKKLEKTLSKLLTLIDILRNNYVNKAFEYSLLVCDT